MPTKPFKIRLPLYLKEAIKKRSNNISGWIIQAIEERLKRDK